MDWQFIRGSRNIGQIIVRKEVDIERRESSVLNIEPNLL